MSQELIISHILETTGTKIFQSRERIKKLMCRLHRRVDTEAPAGEGRRGREKGREGLEGRRGERRRERRERRET